MEQGPGFDRVPIRYNEPARHIGMKKKKKLDNPWHRLSVCLPPRRILYSFERAVFLVESGWCCFRHSATMATFRDVDKIRVCLTCVSGLLAAQNNKMHTETTNEEKRRSEACHAMCNQAKSSSSLSFVSLFKPRRCPGGWLGAGKAEATDRSSLSASVERRAGRDGGAAQ